MKQENIEKLISHCLNVNNDQLQIGNIANLIFEMETVHGLPAEVTIGELIRDNPRFQASIIPIVFKYLTLKVEHSLKSGMEFMGKGHLRMIENNQKIISNLLETGKIETL